MVIIHGAHKATRSSCYHCKQKDHDSDKISGNTHRFHEASGKCPYYRTHKRPKRPKYYSKCVTPLGISKAHSKKKKRTKVTTISRKGARTTKYSLWQDVKGYSGRKRR